MPRVLIPIDEFAADGRLIRTLRGGATALMRELHCPENDVRNAIRNRSLLGGRRYAFNRTVEPTVLPARVKKAKGLEFCNEGTCNEFAQTADPTCADTLKFKCPAHEAAARARGETGIRQRDADTLDGFGAAEQMPDLENPKPRALGRGRALRVCPETAEKVETRVQDISEDDTEKEGFSWERERINALVKKWPYGKSDPVDWSGKVREWFKSLWQKINGKKLGHSWEDNPWVWVVEFKRVKNEVPA